jgi:hypothetical protein
MHPIYQFAVIGRTGLASYFLSLGFICHALKITGKLRSSAANREAETESANHRYHH